MKSASPKRKGESSAIYRAKQLRAGQDLPPHKEAVLGATARLLVHHANISNRLYFLGETKADDEPRALLKSLHDLGAQIVANLKYVFPDGQTEEDDVFSKYQRGETE